MPLPKTTPYRQVVADLEKFSEINFAISAEIIEIIFRERNSDLAISAYFAAKKKILLNSFTDFLSSARSYNFYSEWYNELFLVPSKYPLSYRFFDLEPLIRFADEIALLPLSEPLFQTKTCDKLLWSGFSSWFSSKGLICNFSSQPLDVSQSQILLFHTATAFTVSLLSRHRPFHSISSLFNEQ